MVFLMMMTSLKAKILKIIRWIRQKTTYFIITAPLMLMTGCGGNTDDTYDHAQNQSEMEKLINDVTDDNNQHIKRGFNETIAYYSFKLCKLFKVICIPVCIASVTIGILGLILIKKDPKIRKKCGLGFIIAVPSIMVILTWIATRYASYMLGKI